MKSLETWFAEYGESHTNKLNKNIHFLCVPAIFFSICGLLFSLPNKPFVGSFPNLHPIIANWAFVILVLVVIFYLRLSISMGLKMLVFSVGCLIGNYLIGLQVELWIFSLILFVVGWLGQFYGHHVEGKKPSFMKDLQFLLIGPAWVIDNITSKRK